MLAAETTAATAFPEAKLGLTLFSRKPCVTPGPSRKPLHEQLGLAFELPEQLQPRHASDLASPQQSLHTGADPSPIDDGVVAVEHERPRLQALANPVPCNRCRGQQFFHVAQAFSRWEPLEQHPRCGSRTSSRSTTITSK